MEPYQPQTEPVTKRAHFVPALVVIDMQNDFVTGSLPVPEGGAIVSLINELIKLPFKLRIATADFHPVDHVSFADTHGQPPLSKAIVFHPEDKEKLMGMQQVLWPRHCIAHTGGAEFVDGLIMDKFDATIRKGTHPQIESYSAFRDIWGRNKTELAEILESAGVTDVFYVGLAGDYCVKYTTIDSAKIGFRTWIVVDGVKSIRNDSVAWDQAKKEGVLFTNSDSVKEAMADLK